MCAEETEGFVGPERKRVTNLIKFSLFFFSFFHKSNPVSVHGTGGRLHARVPRGLGGEAALVTVGCFFLFSLVVDVVVAAAGPAPACVRRRRGGCREAQLSRRPVRDCFIVPTVQFSEGQI